MEDYLEELLTTRIDDATDAVLDGYSTEWVNYYNAESESDLYLDLDDDDDASLAL